jgi:hypothetical protein
MLPVDLGVLCPVPSSRAAVLLSNVVCGCNTPLPPMFDSPRFIESRSPTNATLLAAACIVGIAMVMKFYHPRGWQACIGAVFWIAVAFAIIDYVSLPLSPSNTPLDMRRDPCLCGFQRAEHASDVRTW